MLFHAPRSGKNHVLHRSGGHGQNPQLEWGTIRLLETCWHQVFLAVMVPGHKMLLNSVCTSSLWCVETWIFFYPTTRNLSKQGAHSGLLYVYCRTENLKSVLSKAFFSDPVKPGNLTPSSTFPFKGAVI